MGGFNVAPKPITVNDKKYWVGTGSSENYVTKNYGINLGYRKFEDAPIGPYEWAVDKKQPWMVAHGVDEDNLPKNFPTDGWPTAEEFNYYFQNQY